MAANDDVVCGECEQKIDLKLERNIFCDKFCKKYYHKKCSGIGDTEFFFYIDGGTKKFVCKFCRKKMVENRLSSKGTSPISAESTVNKKNEKSLTVDVQVHPATDVIKNQKKGLQTTTTSKSTEIVINHNKTKPQTNH